MRALFSRCKANKHDIIVQFDIEYQHSKRGFVATLVTAWLFGSTIREDILMKSMRAHYTTGY